MDTSDRYRVLVDGKPSSFSWPTMDGAAREAAMEGDEHPYAEIRIRRPDIVVRKAVRRQEDAG